MDKIIISLIGWYKALGMIHSAKHILKNLYASRCVKKGGDIC